MGYERNSIDVVAHWVEHQATNLTVAGSNPVHTSRSVVNRTTPERDCVHQWPEEDERLLDRRAMAFLEVIWICGIVANLSPATMSVAPQHARLALQFTDTAFRMCG